MSAITEKEFKALVTLLDDEDEEVFAHVSDKLFSLGIQSVPMLESVWENTGNEIIQNRLEELIQKIQFSNVKDLLQKWLDVGSEDILEGALIINKFQYPDLDEFKITQKLESLAKSVWIELNPALSALEEVHVINHVFFQLHGYFGQQVQQNDAELNFISQVLETKKGNSISLSILYLILAQKNDLPVYGINLPFHFIMCYCRKKLTEDELAQNDKEKSVQFYINPLSKGISFSRSEITTYLQQMNLKAESKYYSPCNNKMIIRALIYNLLSCYDQNGNKDKARQLKELFDLFTTKEDSTTGFEADFNEDIF